MKNMRVLALVLALTLALTSTAFAGATLPDINNSLYKDAIQTLVDEGIVVGDEDGKFHPENNLTRAQACIMIVKTVAPDVKATADTGKKTPFTDMDESYLWADPYVAYAVEHGIVAGYPGNLFKPGKNVTTVEFLTMVLGAAGYADEIKGTWPEAQINKAKEVGVLDKLETNYPEVATKGMAAQMIANKMADMRGENSNDGDQSFDEIFDYLAKADMKFADASFDAATSTFDGKGIAKNVKVYSYGVEKEFSKDMEFSQSRGDYFEETVYKYKNVETPAWYAVEGGKITMMLVPRDAGFSGRVYGLINGTVTTLNGDGEAVVGFETLTATKEITWLGKKGLTTSVYDGVTPGDGTLFELRTRDGEVQSVATSGAVAEKQCKELTNKAWTTVSAIDSSRELISVEGIGYYEVNENASVYVWNDDDNVYEASNLRKISKGDYVRLYDITDDKVNAADIIVVKEN